MIPLLVYLFILSSVLIYGLGKPLSPFTRVSKLLKVVSKDLDYDVRDFSDSKIENALQIMSSTQSAVKTLDGFTHQLRNSVKDSTSLLSRYKKFIKSKKKSKKEAAKVFEYTNTVEKGLLSAEILQAVGEESSSSRATQLLQAGLTELKRCTVCHQGINCTLSVLCDASDPIFINNATTATSPTESLSKVMKGEIIIAITDSLSSKSSESDHWKSIQSLVRLIKEEAPIGIEVTGMAGSSDDEIVVQPTFLTLTTYVLGNISELLLPDKTPPPSTLKKQTELHLRTNQKKDSVYVGKKVKVVQDIEPKEMKDSRKRLPHRLRIIGYSAGGAVASYAAMTLDGTMNFSKEQRKTHADVRRLALFVGKYNGRVRCMTLGSPPCVSRSVIPQYITSVICGDDIIVRSTSESLKRWARRVYKALKAGAGSGIPLGYVMGSGWMKDVAGTARQSLNRYTGW